MNNIPTKGAHLFSLFGKQGTFGVVRAAAWMKGMKKEERTLYGLIYAKDNFSNQNSEPMFLAIC